MPKSKILGVAPRGREEEKREKGEGACLGCLRSRSSVGYSWLARWWRGGLPLLLFCALATVAVVAAAPPLPLRLLQQR